MDSFKITFQTSNVPGNTPAYKVVISTEGPNDTLTDSDILIIQRIGAVPYQIDELFGIARANDFSTLRRATPNPGQYLYRAHSWTLIFYSQQTMDDCLNLMRAQVDQLAEEVKILRQMDRNRSETHIAPIPDR